MKGIDHSTNSCCRHYLLAESSTSHVSLSDDDKIIEDYPVDCAGCNRTSAFVLKAIEEGIDTVYIQKIAISLECGSSNIADAEMYIIEVKGKE